MKKLFKKILIGGSLCAIASTSMIASNVMAAYQDNNVSYSFRIQGSVDNAQEAKGRFRETKDNTNSWKIQLKESGEGSGTYTTFWIENENGKSASAEYVIQQGKPAKYKMANDKGDHITVYLTAENNNFCSTKQYNVSGIWDEETGIYL
ncbi:MAG: DUF2712 domain-containing protein [Ruminococcus sp.]|nr:DUF2712 domain-containing protein [Ruminococcus sp.]